MISIIVPLYNKESVILNTLISIASQDYQDWECVIVNDGSTDNSAQVVRDYISLDNRFALYTKANGGPSSARNYGVEKAMGEWIVFLDADDIFEDNALEIFGNSIKNYSTFNCIAYNFWVEHEGSKYLYTRNIQSSRIKNPYKEWFANNFMPRTGAALFRKSVLLKYKFKDYLRRYEDAEMIFNVFRNESIFYVNVPVMIYQYDNKDASCVRNNFQEDFFAHLMPKRKPFWEQVLLYQFYRSSLVLYGEQAKKVYPKSPFNTFMEVRINLTLKLYNLKKLILG